MSISGRRTPMKLYTDPVDQYSHRVRMVLAEKRIVVNEELIKPPRMPDDLAELNPGGQIPTLVDRDLVLYHSMVIMEYLDERYPHPPLLPVYPVARAESRKLIMNIDYEWSRRLDIISGKGYRATQRKRAKDELRELIVTTNAQFSSKQFFMNNDFTLVDCCAAPVLWRLDHIGIKLPNRQTRNLKSYMNRVFGRESFRRSMSEDEEEMRRL